jgi:hypothetical protein
VAPACNPSYSGSRDQEDHGSWLGASPGKQFQETLSQKKTLYKKELVEGGVAQSVGPEFKP